VKFETPIIMNLRRRDKETDEGMMIQRQTNLTHVERSAQWGN
jgi:hypothetical protein